MNMHKRIRLTPLDRQEMWRLYQTRSWKVTHLAEHFRVSRPTAPCVRITVASNFHYLMIRGSSLAKEDLLYESISPTGVGESL